MQPDEDITMAVDSMVDNLELIADMEARRLGIDTDEVMDRVANEIKARYTT